MLYRGLRKTDARRPFYAAVLDRICFSLVRGCQRDTDNRAAVDKAHAKNDSAES